ncbi:MAG: hypothetical protein GF353_26065 [Candidatus Lokiarchaeota archaeon]|nr:hypothetical protein [Candidatus Lokiarchaeota archaeon]
MRPSPQKIEKAKKFIPEYSKLCLNYVRPILFGDLPLESIDPLLKGATITFINTGERSLGITNYHVFEKYLELKKQNKNTICQIDSLIFDPESRLIDFNEDRKVDLVTIDITDDEFAQINAMPLYHKVWPVKITTEREIEPVFILGYPGHLRYIHSVDRIDATFGALMLTIDTITDKNLIIVCNRDNWVVDYSIYGEVDISRFRGFSGAGVFRMNNLTPELLGIISGHAEELLDVFYCSRSDLIEANGRLLIND